MGDLLSVAGGCEVHKTNCGLGKHSFSKVGSAFHCALCRRSTRKTTRKAPGEDGRVK